MPSIESARAWYSETDPVHGFDHVLRVYRLAERMAVSEGADVEIVRAAALLHDATGDTQLAPDEADEIEAGDDNRLEHHSLSAIFAAQVLEQEGWTADRIAAVTHCIRAHRFRDDTEQPLTLEAKILFDADKLDAIGAIGVARAIAFAAREGQPAYASPSESFMHNGLLEIGEPHSAYHEYLFKLRWLKDRLYTTTARAMAEERHRFMVSFFKHLAAEMETDS